jgi:hypothetical protein
MQVAYGASTPAFNLTLCPADKCTTETPDAASSMAFTESNDWSSFNWSTISFGKTYYNDGIAQSDYFTPYSAINNQTIQFNINSNGALLPVQIW